LDNRHKSISAGERP